MDDTEKLLEEEEQLARRIKSICSTSLGVLQAGFLCQSVSVLTPKAPICVSLDTPLAAVIELLQQNKIGCIVITGTDGKIAGIFTERDCLLKVLLKNINLNQTKISSVMTADPVRETPDTTIAFVLNLMSNGGFRHLPLVDPDDLPIGILSVKDVVDYIVARFVDDVMNIPGV